MGVSGVIDQINKVRAEGLVLGMPAVLAGLGLVIVFAFGAGAWITGSNNSISSNTLSIRSNTKDIAAIKSGVDDIKRMISKAAADRWTATNMREWQERTRTMNPSWKSPSIDELRSYRYQQFPDDGK